MRKVKTLIVDDSVVFRSQIRAGLPLIDWIEIVGTAANGKVALEKLRLLEVDLVILDLEMPEMNGIQTLYEMKKGKMAAKVLVFSAHSTRGAEITLEALSLGATDFITKPKQEEPIENSALKPAELLKNIMLPKLQSLFMDYNRTEEIVSSEKSQTEKVKFNWAAFNPQAVLIGCSTGGPTALEYLFSKLRGPLLKPIFIVQHMPALFTATLAERLTKISGIKCAEAANGEIVVPNRVYMAPGNFHMELVQNSGLVNILVNQSEPENMVRPAVDPLFRSAAGVYKNACLAMVLTGMGKDGLAGSKRLRETGAPVLIQNQESCVVYGMPKALHDAGEYDLIQNLDELSLTMKKYACGKEV